MGNGCREEVRNVGFLGDRTAGVSEVVESLVHREIVFQTGHDSLLIEKVLVAFLAAVGRAAAACGGAVFDILLRNRQNVVQEMIKAVLAEKGYEDDSRFG